MRYASFLVVVSLAIGFLATPAASTPSASPKTIRVNWNEKKEFEGGYLAFRVTRLIVQGARWTVAARITNQSKRTIDIDAVTHPAARLAGLSLAYPVPSQGGYGYDSLPGTKVLEMRTSKPRIPARLGPGEMWTGTFGGNAVLPKRKPLWVIFGWFVPDGEKEEGFNHITAHAFRL